MEKHPIDHRFKQSLKGMEKQPRPDSWQRIEARISQEKKGRKIPLWYYGVAASLLLTLLAGLAWLQPIGVKDENAQRVAPHASKGKEVQQASKPFTEKKQSISSVAVVPLQTSPSIQTSTKPAGMSISIASEREAYQVEISLPQPQLKGDIAAIEPLEKTSPLPERAIATEVVATNPTAPNPTPVTTNLMVKLTNTELDDSSGNQPRKRTRLGRILRQLKNVKEGEQVDWKEVGINPNTILARAEDKLEKNTQKVTRSYQDVKEKINF